MGTKNNPGNYDCYAKADPDEPMFILLGRDPFAGLAAGFWASIQKWDSPENEKKYLEAFECSEALTAFAHNLGKEKEISDARKSMRLHILRLAELVAIHNAEDVEEFNKIRAIEKEKRESEKLANSP